MTGKVIIIRGIPGSGKTTLARQMIEADKAHEYYEADMFMVDDDGRYQFDPSKLHSCHQACFRAVKSAFERGATVIVSNTFTLHKYYEQYLELDPDAKIIICNGNYQNVHGVPVETIERMRAEFQY